MKNGRMANKRILKWVASGVMLALLFAMVFAGTLSGAFGVEESLKNSGVIENNVADAAWAQGYQGTKNDTETKLLSDENKGLYYGNQYLNSTISAFTDGVIQPSGYSYLVYFTDGSTKEAGARIFYHKGNTWIGSNKDADDIYLGWYVTFNESMYRAINNGAIDCIDFKVNTYSPGSDDKRILKLRKGNSGEDILSSQSSVTGSNATNSVTLSSANLNNCSKDSSGNILNRQYQVFLELGIVPDGDMDVYFHSAWVDIYKSDTTAPTITHTPGTKEFVFEDSGDNAAGIYTIEKKVGDGAYTDITSSCGLSPNTKTGSYTCSEEGQLVTFRVTDNVGNIKETQYYLFEGTGSSNDPFLLRNRTEFDWLSTYTNGGYAFAGKYFQVGESSGATINMATSTTAFTPIGKDTSHPFKGIIDGNGCTIDKLTVETDSACAGLFGRASGATFKNIQIGTSDNHASITGVGTVGGLVGYCVEGTNCQLVGKIICYTDVTGTSSFVGGVVGRNHGNIDNATFTHDGTVNGNSANSVGGIFGFTGGNLKNAVNSGSVTGGTATGGIVGRIQGTLENCVNYASVESSAIDAHSKEVGSEIANFPKLSAVGGITGYCNGNVKDCYNYGSVTAQGSGVGGIIGINGLFNDDKTWTIGAISGCVNSGDVSAKPGVGGIIGYVIGSSVSGCTNTGKVTANKDAVAIDGSTLGAYAGGIAGYANGDVQHNYNEGTVTTVSAWSSSNLVGGIAGCLASGKTVSYCYNKGTVEGSSLVGGIVGKNDGTLEFCYQDARINGIWNSINAELGYISGNDKSVISKCWILPNASDNTGLTMKVNEEEKTFSSISFKSNGYSLKLGDDVSYLPAVWDEETNTYTISSWEQIVPYTKTVDGQEKSFEGDKINAFVVTGSVEKGQFFLSKKGIGGDYLTPSSIESKESATEGVEYEITARYNADIGSNIYCAVTDIGYDNSNKTYNGQEQALATTPSINNNGVYTVDINYGTTNNATPKNADTYTVSITIKIDNLVVGKKESISYTIDKAVLTIGEEWTGVDNSNGNHQYTYNAGQQGLTSFTISGLCGSDKIGDDEAVVVTYNTDMYGDQPVVSDNRYTYALLDGVSVNASDANYSVTISIVAANYTFKNSNNNDIASVDYSWTIKPFNLSKLENETAEAYKNRVMFGGYGNDLVISNTSANELKITNYNVLTYELNNALIYTGSGYNNSSFAVFVRFGDFDHGSIVQLNENGAEEYTLWTSIKNGDFKKELQSGDSEPVAITIKAEGDGNFTGEIEYTFTGMDSDFGGNYTKNKDDENDPSDWGTLSNPFKISHPAHLIRLSEIVNGKDAWNSWTSLNDKVANGINSNSYSGAYFKVTAYIDLASYLGKNVSFTPIGYVDGEYFWRQDKNEIVEETADEKLHPFSGTFNGDDNAINLYVNAANTDFVGLFGLTQNATITNITVAGNVTGGTYVAGIVGHALKTDITNCTNNATISGVSYVGGIVGMAGNYKTHYPGYGFNASSLTNTGAITGTGSYVGGLAGYSRDVNYKGTISNSANIKGNSNTGGIMGTLCGGSLEGAENKGNVEGTAYTGGITGRVTWSSVSGTLTNSGNVKGTAGVGGIVGAFNCTISGVNANKDLNSTWSTTSLENHGTVEGTNYVGGIFGACNTGYSTPTTVFKAGTVVNDNNVTGTGTYVGSVAGWLDASANEYNFVIEKKNDNSDANIIIDTTTTVTVTGKNFVGYLFGGLVGNGYSEETNAKTTKLKIDNTFSGNVNGTSGGAVLGGLVGYMSKSALMFNCDWNTSNIGFGTMGNMSFVGGIVGVLGEGGYISNLVTYQDGDFVAGDAHTITANTEFSGLGSFVGGIVGYVSATAGYNGYAFKNVMFVNTSAITGGSYVGGIIGAIGRFDTTNANTIANNYSDVSDILEGYLDAFDGTLILSSDAVQLTNSANITGTGNYVGGIVGYVAGNVRVVLTGTLDTNNEPTTVTITGANYVGGLFGYLDNTLYSKNASGSTTTSTLDQALTNIPVRVSLSGTSNVGGIAGRMEGGKIANCIVILDDVSGTSNVGGLVGYTNNVSVDSSFTTGMSVNDDMVSNATIGGLVGGGVNPTVEKSWAFLTANSGATYATVSKNTYGKYVAVDSDVARAYTFAYKDLVGFTSNDAFTFYVNVPTSTLDLENTQLAFYNASGNDTVTGNEFESFENKNEVLTIKLDKEDGESMLVYVVDIKFTNIAQWYDGIKDSEGNEISATTTVANAYRRPSNSERYSIDVGTAEFYTNEEYKNTINYGQVKSIGATVSFNGVSVGTAQKVGIYEKENITIGGEDRPITISSWSEWIEFADSVRKGNKYETTVDGKTTKLVVSLTTDITLTSLKWTADDGTTYNAMAGDSTHSFKGIFEGNGHSITLSKTIDDSTNSLSLFPYANDATFKNLTIKGADGVSIKSSGNGTAAFVGIAGGSLTFENCTNQVEITSSGKNVGGILGQTAYEEEKTYKAETIYYTYTFIDCVNTAELKNTANSTVTGLGGIVGNVITSSNPTSVDYGSQDTGNYISKITFESCRNAGNLKGTFNIGGIIGRNGGVTTITNCGNSGDLIGYGENVENNDFKSSPSQVNKMDTSVGGIGGLVTQNASTDVYASYNSGDILGWGNKAGGILAADCEYTTSDKTTHIYYCYNTGDIKVGGNVGGESHLETVANFTATGCNAGGILGTMINADIQFCYNTGKITGNGVAFSRALLSTTIQSRIGGIVGYADGTSNKTINYCYNIGKIEIGANETSSDGASPIVGLLSDDASGKVNADTETTTNYSINGLVEKYDGSTTNSISGISGTLLESEADLTATMSNTKPSGFDITALSDTEYDVDKNDYKTGKDAIKNADGGYIYVYGCLPQLAVFAVDTQNGLAMTSVAYGKDQYGDFSLQTAGSESNPFIIKDGIDLLGLQSLVEMRYTFEDKYIEFANKNNNLNATEAKEIVFNDSSNRYKTKNGSNYNENGKSYHLFEKGDQSAIKYDDSTTPAPNMLAIGSTQDKAFHGNISGIQYKSDTEFEATKLVDVKVSTGLFANVLNADISYIELKDANISGGANTGGIVGTAYGRTTIDHCKISGTSSITSEGNDVGGIVGYADTANGYMDDTISVYAQGVTLTISNCEVAGSENNAITIQGANSCIGGILGCIASGAGGKNNIVVISGCTVGGASISASSDGTKIGGILGYGSSNIIAGIRDCTVGGSATTDAGSSSDAMVADDASTASTINAVSISGKQNVGGIAGAMSAVQGGYIQDCTVNGNATISATDTCSDIGGLVGSNDEGSGATLTFSGKIVFGGTIDLGGKKANVKTENGKEVENLTGIGGIIGTMNNGASFASGSEVAVGGKIENVDSGYNIGGVAGYTVNVAFNGTFKVSPTMNTENAGNVGGFIGKNTGETHILADDTLVMINGTISGTNEVGGFIGVNDSGAQLIIGAYTYNGKSYNGDVNIYIGAKENGTNSDGTTAYISDDNSSISGTSNVGGIVGKNDTSEGEKAQATLNIVRGTIVNYATIRGTSDNVGGIVGLNDGELTTVSPTITNYGNVSGASYVGGVFGKLNAGTITGTFTNIGNVTGTTSYVGGSIGYVASGVTISNAEMTNTGNVFGGTIKEGTNGTITIDQKTASKVGGSIGELNGTFSGSLSNSGSVSGVSFVGGSIGNLTNTANGTFINEGNVIATGNYVGGSIGYVGNTISGSLSNSGSVSGVSYVGGAIGSFNSGSYDKASIENTGTVTGTTSYVGGAIGYIASGVTISNATIKNTRNVLGQTTTTSGTSNTANYVGGSIGALYGSLSGTLSNEGSVDGANYVGGSIGYVGKDASINNQTSGSTSFTNIGAVTASGNFVGGSIGILYGSINGSNTNRIVFTVENKKVSNGGNGKSTTNGDGQIASEEATATESTNVNVSGTGYVGGSIGVIAGRVSNAQFTNNASLTVTGGQTAIGGSVGMVGVPSDADQYDSIELGDIIVSNSQFDALGSLTVTNKSTSISGDGGVGGAIGIIGNKTNNKFEVTYEDGNVVLDEDNNPVKVKGWDNNTYYAQSDVIADGIDNVGGVFGLIKADNFSISNMLAYRITVRGADGVGGIVGGVEGSKVTISSAFALEGNISGDSNVGGIVGKANDTTNASQAYWMLGIANSTIATEGVGGLATKLGFTSVNADNEVTYGITTEDANNAYSTGNKATGWFFIYATADSLKDANGNIIGANNVVHNEDGDADKDLAYWKRIANAYSADERVVGDDNYSDATRPLKSSLTSSITEGTIYATASSSTYDGYYMYTATSNGTPNIAYDNANSRFNVNINITSNVGTDGKFNSNNYVGNFAVYYREITVVEELTYNGYYREASTDLGKIGDSDYVAPIKLADVKDTGDENNYPNLSNENASYSNTYRYTTATKIAIKDEQGNITGYKDITESMIDPGSYTSEFYVYYYDKEGKPYLVGSIQNQTWTIEARTLEVEFTSRDNKKYGETSDADDMTITVTNVEPEHTIKYEEDGEIKERKASNPITINVKFKQTNESESVLKTKQFTWNGITEQATSSSITIADPETSDGITITVDKAVGTTAMSGSDIKYVVGGVTDSSTRKYTFHIKFSDTYAYEVELSSSTGHYEFHNSEEKNNNKFSVGQRELIITRTLTSGNSYENTNKADESYTYNVQNQGVNGIKVNEGSNTTITGLISGDTVKIHIIVKKGDAVFKEYYAYASSTANLTVTLGALDVGTYTVSYGVAVDDDNTTNSGKYFINDAIVDKWKIETYKISLTNAEVTFEDGDGKQLSSKTYDAKAVIPVLSNFTDNNLKQDTTDKNKYTYKGDTITIKYNGALDNKLVNAGKYSVSIGSGSGSITATHGNDTTGDATQNYELKDSASGQFTITARALTLVWQLAPSNSYVANGWVYDGKYHGLLVYKATSDGGKEHASTISNTSSWSTQSFSDQLVTLEGCENDTITITCSGSKINSGSNYQMSASITGGTNGGDINLGNYEIGTNATSPNAFSIEKSIIKISSINVNNISKVYDGNEWLYRNNKYEAGVTGKITISKVESINGGADGSTSYFTLSSAKFIGKNATDVVTAQKQIEATFTFSTSNTNYTCDSDSLTQKPTAGKITRKEITVTLNLSGGKATKTYDGTSTFGGANGATGNNQSQVYITGNGFKVSDVLDGDNVTIKAVFEEADRNNSACDSYVNGVYKKTDGTYEQDASTYFKCLVFTMVEGGAAGNYSLKVTGNSKTWSGANSVTVNGSGDNSIPIEITKKTVRVEYTNTYQSYVAANGSYNTSWTSVKGSVKNDSTPAIEVINGWMYKDGKDDGGKTDKQYNGYTVITGKKDSPTLSAQVTTDKGMNYNYTLSNQPTLTIAYVVTDTADGAFEIDSIADLIIASVYYSAKQNVETSKYPFVNEVQSSYVLHELGNVETEFDWDSVKDKIPQDVCDKLKDEDDKSWRKLIDALDSSGYPVENNDGTIVYIEATSSYDKSKIPTSFKLTKDLNGILTANDIKMLNSFFTVTYITAGEPNEATYTWGIDKEYLSNLLTTNEGSVVTLLGSLFVTDSGKDGFDGMFDGNGYVIEYLNIIGYGKDNVGLFDVIGAGTVKNLHLRNISINANKGNVGGIAGKIASGDNLVTDVSFHGSINVSGEANVGGLFGQSLRVIQRAIVLGTINSSNSNANVGGVVGNSTAAISGVVGNSTAAISNVVSMMQITANGTNTHAFVGTGTNATNSYHMQNAVYTSAQGTDNKVIGFVNDSNAAVSYSNLMNGLDSSGASVNYDKIDESGLPTSQNARQSLRLVDIVKVYLLMYSLNATTDTDGKITGYTIGDSWLVGSKLGTNAANDAIVIANKQNVSLLRELRFATFELATNIDVTISSTFSGAFYGTVSGGYKITCNKDMFGVYLNDKSSWLKVSANS